MEEWWFGDVTYGAVDSSGPTVKEKLVSHAFYLSYLTVLESKKGMCCNCYLTVWEIGKIITQM
jgi:hypothetical protein